MLEKEIHCVFGILVAFHIQRDHFQSVSEIVSRYKMLRMTIHLFRTDDLSQPISNSCYVIVLKTQEKTIELMIESFDQLID